MGKCNLCSNEIIYKKVKSNFNSNEYEFCGTCSNKIKNNFLDYGDTKANMFLTAYYERKKNLRFFGLEFEFDHSELTRFDKGFLSFDANKNLFDKDVIECKRDSSLCDGFELTFQPASYNWICENFNEIARLLKFCCDNSSNDNAGFHIHINKESISFGKMEYIMNILIEDRENFIEFFGRTSSSSNDWCFIPSNNDYCNWDNHYQALRNTPLNTYEFRLPKGVRNVDDFITYYIGFVTLLNDCYKINTFNDCYKINTFNDFLNNFYMNVTLFKEKIEYYKSKKIKTA